MHDLVAHADRDCTRSRPKARKGLHSLLSRCKVEYRRLRERHASLRLRMRRGKSAPVSSKCLPQSWLRVLAWMSPICGPRRSRVVSGCDPSALGPRSRRGRLGRLCRDDGCARKAVTASWTRHAGPSKSGSGPKDADVPQQVRSRRRRSALPEWRWPPPAPRPEERQPPRP